MIKTLTAAALAGALSFAALPAMAQSNAPEPPQGAQPMDNPGAGGSMDKGSSMEKGSMKKSSMKHHRKHHMKHHKSM